MEVKPTSITLVEGDTTEINAEVLPSSANQGLTVVSLDSTIADVAKTRKRTVQTYNVTGKKVGTTKIKFTSTEDTTKSAEVNVTVTAKVIVPTDIVLNPTSIELEKGTSTEFTATVMPANAENTNVTLNLVDANVQTVVQKSKAGNVTTFTVTGLNAGTDRFEVKSGTITKSITTTVSEVAPIEVEDIVLSEKFIELDVGQSKEVEATIFPEGTDQTVKVEFDIPGISSYKITTGSVIKYSFEGLKTGHAKATFSCVADEKVKATLDIYVNAPTTITTDTPKVTVMKGENIEIEVDVNPDSAGQDLDASTENATIAKVKAVE